MRPSSIFFHLTGTEGASWMFNDFMLCKRAFFGPLRCFKLPSPSLCVCGVSVISDLRLKTVSSSPTISTVQSTVPFDLLAIDLYYVLVKPDDSCCGKGMMAAFACYISYITRVCPEQGLMGIPLYPALLIWKSLPVACKKNGVTGLCWVLLKCSVRYVWCVIIIILYSHQQRRDNTARKHSL